VDDVRCRVLRNTFTGHGTGDNPGSRVHIADLVHAVIS
jgi:hypothetical protein